MSTIDTKSNHADEMKPNMQKGTKRAATDRSDEPKRPRFLSEKCRHPRLIAFEEREAACQLLIDLFDSNRDGMIDRNEFRPLWKYVDEWKISFKNIAAEGELTIGVDRLETALREYGEWAFLSPIPL
ncbi:hypothetical protein niasHS_005128 [Heterodera schachtii]|uniref:EF-hand domain-containing protein n=1 Tax=Heterodera schachtii TaxID=97005 RepID=A0ABD2JTJ6_HETSC